MMHSPPKGNRNGNIRKQQSLIDLDAEQLERNLPELSALNASKVGVESASGTTAHVKSVSTVPAQPGSSGSNPVTTDTNQPNPSGTVGTLRKTKSSRKNSKKRNSCKLCTSPDNDEMVACDVCNAWFHFQCVNVDESVSEVPWKCASCESKSIHNKSKPQSIRSNRSMNMERLEEQRQLERKLAEEDRRLQEERDKKYLETMRQVEQRFINSKLELEASGSSSSSVISAESSLNRTSEWINNVRQISKTNQPSTVIRGPNPQSAAPMRDHPAEEKPTTATIPRNHTLTSAFVKKHCPAKPASNPYGQSTPTHKNMDHEQHLDPCSHAPPFTTFAGMANAMDPWNNPRIFSEQGGTNASFVLPNTSTLQGRQLTESQIAARLVMIKRGLPEFSGLPREWPAFIGAYTRTTEKCGFNDDENLERLLTCLKGEARNLVKARLISPSMVASVMNTLYRNYGRPDIILEELIENVRSQPIVKHDRLDLLVKLSAAVEDLSATLENSMLSDHLNNPILLKELVRKLPSHFQLSWSFYTEGQANVNLSTFNQWLINIANAASRVPSARPQNKDEPREEKSGRKKVRGATHLLGTHDVSTNSSQPKSSDISKASDTVTTCFACGKHDHLVTKCDSFIAMPSPKRWSIVVTKRLCRTCLGKHHTRNCSLRKTCGVDGCESFHNPLLHNQRVFNQQEANTTIEPKSSTSIERNHHHQTHQTVMYRILPIKIFGNGKTLNTFAFLDDGSSISLLDESVAHELGLEGPASDLCLKWTSDVSRVESGSQKIDLEISGVDPWSKNYQMSGVYTVKNLDLPSQTLQIDNRHRHLQNLPITTYKHAKPTILIGLDHMSLSLPLKVREGHKNMLAAAKTRLGWTIYGPTSQEHSELRLNFHSCECNDEVLTSLVKNFFSLESTGVTTAKMAESREDIRALEILRNTTVKRGGRYETGLLWRREIINLPDSRPIAERRLLCLEKKLAKDPELLENVRRQFKDYVSKGYARQINEVEMMNGTITNYLPVFAVRHPNKPAKVRLVWDAATKVMGTSLNDVLLKGPDLVPLLLDVLYKFRERPIAISGDIAEMFHQVMIRREDQDAQRFLWRDCDTTRPPDTFIMQVMTFGATCSPSSAQFVKNLNAEKFIHDHPRAVRAIHDHHYVDDYLDSFGTIEEAVAVIKTVTEIHASGGFTIRNWLSNSTDVLRRLGIDSNQSPKNISCVEAPLDKVLGLSWDTQTDTFVFTVKNSRIDETMLEKIPTKREMLRTIMRIFDPLGLIASFLVFAKIILQETWNSGIDWDTPINDKLTEKWKLWAHQLKSIEKVAIPRCYVTNWSNEMKYELHIFVDASEAAYAAVAYIRAVYDNGGKSSLICSKTRVAPNKPTSIPRLELMAAVLGARLQNSVISGHSIDFQKTIIWSDSHTVLSWLRSDARKYRQFVALRISECLELTEVTQWRWVPSKMNVADEATKWVNPNFHSNSRWYNGPEFLNLESSLWPKEIRGTDVVMENEMRPCLVISTDAFNVPECPDSKRCSSWTRLRKIQAIIIRAIWNWTARLSRHAKRFGPIEINEWAEAETALYKKVQWDEYKDELIQLSKGLIDKTSKIYHLSPYKDEVGLIRMQGRIDRAEGIPASMKNPIVLPQNHHVTFLIVDHYHRRFQHRNHETVVNEVRQRFVIPKLRVVLRTIRRKCQHCMNLAARPHPPPMASLPRERLMSFRRPFSYVGLDFFGPMEVTVGRRVEKRYGALFTCMTTRAIHLEVAHSLSSDSCIQCIIRFMSRRGTAIQIVSDNGTNFRGANNELKRLLENIPKNELSIKFPEIEWKFNPPSSPHFGGAWERLVRSVKSNVHGLLHTRRPSDETLLTALIEVENIINSRPLTDVQLDSSDQEALTPNHILLGTSDGRKPFFEMDGEKDHFTKQWKTAQQMAQQFWKRWVREYLPTLRRKTKWFKPVRPLGVGDIVIIIDERSPYNTWPKGVVQDVHVGEDGEVRSAVVKVGKSSCTKPAVKLAVLDVRDKILKPVTYQGGECCG